MLLAIFLGYEGDRAMGLFENVDPHRCILIVPKPAFHPEWEGRTEKMNTTIIRALGKKSIRYADSRNPIKVALVFFAGYSFGYNVLPQRHVN